MLRFVHGLGVRYVTCSGLIPSGGAVGDESRATALTEQQLTDCLLYTSGAQAARLDCYEVGGAFRRKPLFDSSICNMGGGRQCTETADEERNGHNGADDRGRAGGYAGTAFQALCGGGGRA